MVLVDSIGNNGTFYYPKLDLIATAMILKDVSNLSLAVEEDKLAIMQMRANPDSLKIHELKNKEITIDFELGIPHLNKWDLSEAITTADCAFLESEIQEESISLY